MPRSLVLGNGSSLLCFDSKGLIRDFYFHYVGLENHMYEGCLDRIGIFVDGVFSWINSADWNTLIDLRHETLSSSIIAVNEKLQIELLFHDVLYNEADIFIRKVTVKNKANYKRQVKVFFNHQFHFYETVRGDTAYFDPSDNTIVHYKGRRIVVIGGDNNGKSFDDYTIGFFQYRGQEGTWRDSEDGVLSKNPIEHGPVDSTICFSGDADTNSQFEFSLYLTYAKTLKEAKDLYKSVTVKTISHLIKSTEDFWHAWVNKMGFNFYDLSSDVIDLFKKSLLIMRAHVDNNGSIIASGDSDMLQYGHDTYGYVWMRDGAYVSRALDMAGYPEVSRKFFEFANDVISSEGYFFHKYRADKSVGSSWHPYIKDGVRQLPIQEDETASVIWALWNHYQHTLDLEFIENVYNSLVIPASNFMLGFRDGTTKLCAPSYDLWEMKYGISTYTSANVYAALIASSNFAKLLGKEKDEKIYMDGAMQMKEAILKYLYDAQSGYFYKLIDIKNGAILHDNTVDISSFYGLFKFEVLGVEDSKLTSFLKIIKDKLMCQTKLSGVSRFENDQYYRASKDIPGNPWFITTLWFAQYQISISKSKEELQKAKEWLSWVFKNALPSGVLSEQVDPFTGAQLSASPLSWSHAEFVITVLEYIKKMESLNK